MVSTRDHYADLFKVFLRAAFEGLLGFLWKDPFELLKGVRVKTDLCLIQFTSSKLPNPKSSTLKKGDCRHDHSRPVAVHGIMNWCDNQGPKAQQLAKHRKILLSRNWLPAKIPWSLHCCHWYPAHFLLSIEICQEEFSAWQLHEIGPCAHAVPVLQFPISWNATAHDHDDSPHLMFLTITPPTPYLLRDVNAKATAMYTLWV